MPLKPDFIDTEIHDVPVRVYYFFESGYEGESDSVRIVKVTYEGKDVNTAFAIALYGDVLEDAISESENAEYSPEHDD